MAEGNPLNRYEFAGAYDPRYTAERIIYHAQNLGIDPEIALRVARSEGLHGYVGDEGSSFGPFQLHYGNVASGDNRVGGLGDTFTRVTGLDARDPRTVDAQIQFALSEAKRTGWGPWHGWKGDKWAGISGDHPQSAQPLYETGRFIPQDGPLMAGPAGPQLPPGYMAPQPLAYTAAPEQPSFPPLTQREAQAREAQARQAQAAPQTYTPEDFFEGKHLQQAPVQQAPIQVTAPQTYTPEDMFAGKHLEAAPQAPAVTTMPAAPRPGAPEQVAVVPQGEWGAGREFARGAISGLTGGLGDLSKAGATVRAGYEALTGQAPEGFMARRREITQGLEEARRAYERTSPMTAAISESLGAGLGTAAPLGLAAKGIGMGARALGAARPAIAPILEGAGQFLGGQGEFMWGLPSKAAAGATYGLGETALTQQLMPEEDRGLASFARGAGGGAAVNAVLGTLGAPISKILKAELNESLVPVAKKANEKYGLGVRAGQVAKDAEVKNLDEMLVPQHVHDKQIQKMTEAISKELELGGKPLTNTNITQKMEDIGQEIGNTVANRTIPTRGGNGAYTQLTRDVNNIFQGVAGKLNPGDPEVPLINNFLRGLRSSFASGQMSGDVFQNYIAHNGRIANAFRNTGRAALQGVEHDLREAFLNAFEKAHPTVAPRFRDARETYKKLAAIDTIVAGSEAGVIDPKKLMKQVEKRNISGNLRELAEIGQHLPSVTSTGAAKVRGPSGLYRDAASVASVGVPLAEAVGASIPFGSLVSKIATGKLFSEALQSQALRSKMMTRARFYNPEMTGAFGQQMGNVLLGGPTAFTSGVGGMERSR